MLESAYTGRLAAQNPVKSVRALQRKGDFGLAIDGIGGGVREAHSARDKKGAKGKGGMMSGRLSRTTVTRPRHPA